MTTDAKKRPGALWATDADVEKPRIPMTYAVGGAVLFVAVVGLILSQVDLDAVVAKAKQITKAVIVEDKPPPPPPPPPKPPEPQKVEKIVKRQIPIDSPPPPVPVPDSPPPAIPVADNPSPTAPSIGTAGASGPAVAPSNPAPASSGPVAIGLACSSTPPPEIPQKVTRSGAMVETVVKVHARVVGGKIGDVEVVSYSGQAEFRSDFIRAIKGVMQRYVCENKDLMVEQEFDFIPPR